jgi:excisionase family DNA binding protein
MAFLTMEAAAKELGMSKHSLRIAAKTGKLPGARKVGGRWFIHRATLEKYFTQTLPPDVRPVER